LKGKKLGHVTDIGLLILADTADIRWEKDLVTF
jgi:hypothetical protein